MKTVETFQYEDVLGFKFGSNPAGPPFLFSHVYCIDGLMIDTGHRRMKQEILQQVGHLEIEQIYLTHHHEDHTGNSVTMQEHFKCPVYASTQCVEIMKNPPKISPAQWLIWGNSTPNHNLLAKESFIETSKYRLEIIPAPGHAVDMVCLYLPEKGWLFSADLWVSEYIRYFMRSESMKEQIDSIKEILKRDFEVLFCGHNPQMRGGKEKMKNKLKFLEDFYGKVAELHPSHTPNQILKKMRLREKWGTRLLSLGELSTLNMIKSVIRDEANKTI